MPGPIEYFGAPTFYGPGRPSSDGGIGKNKEQVTGFSNKDGLRSAEEALRGVKELGGEVFLPSTEAHELDLSAERLDPDRKKIGLCKNRTDPQIR